MVAHPDDERQQAVSCLAHGLVHNAEDMKILSIIVFGAEITEVFSPARATKLCECYGLIPGDSFDLMTGYI